MIEQFQNIRYYVFDLYGTLVDIHTDEEKMNVWEQMSVYYSNNGADYKSYELKQAYEREVRLSEQRMKNAHPDISDPEISLLEVFHKLYLEKNVQQDFGKLMETAVHFRKITTEYIRPYPFVNELIETLKSQGKVFLLSNAQGVFTRWELYKLGMTSFFDGIYISSECGCKKPDIHFYRKLLEDEKILPKEAVMIGNDGICDIAGAKRAGMKTIYIHSNLSPNEKKPPADYVLEEMDLVKLRIILKST